MPTGKGRLRAALAVAGAVLVAAAGCRETPQAAGGQEGDGRVTIAVGGQAALVYLPTTLAQELGYYEDEGLDVTIEDFEGGSEALQSLLAGSADVVSGFYDHTIQMAAQGRELKAFVTMLRYPGLKLVVAPDSADDVDSVRDLAGKTVGVTAPGSSTDLFLKFLLSKEGMDTDAASVTAIGATSTAVAAMEQGQVAAGVMVEPAVAALAQRVGDLKILADTSTAEGVQEVFGVSSYPASVFYTTSQWLEDNPDTARGLARAIVRALEYVHSHSPEEIAEAMPDEFVGDDPQVYLGGLQASMETFSDDGVMEPDGPPAVLEVLSLSLPEVRNADIDVEATYTNEFVQE